MNDNSTMSYYAKLASLSYATGNRRKNLLESTFRNLQPVAELSNESTTTLIDPATGKLYISFRGTDLSTRKSAKEDLTSDAYLAAGRLTSSKRYKADDALVKAAVAKYGAENVTLAGTSLGGRLAQDLANKYGTTAHAFNAGSTPIDVFSALNPTSALAKRVKGVVQNKGTIYHYNAVGDPISAFDVANTLLNGTSKEHQTFVAPRAYTNPHSLENFIGRADYAEK